MRLTTFFVPLAAIGLSVASPASSDDRVSPAMFAGLQAADLKVTAIGYRLVTANAALCRELQPELGMSLQALDQYGPSTRKAADEAFGFEAMVSIEGVVQGAPAERAGVNAGDSLVAVEGFALPAKPAGPANAGTPATRNAVENHIANAAADRPIRLTLRKNGRDRIVVVQPVPGCRTAVELVLDEGWSADSNGDRIRIGLPYVERFDEQDLAVIMAHELAHAILHHRARLDAAKVSRGLLAEFGRNARLFRQTEDEADRLSVTLLYNAGYDPSAAFGFWHDKAPSIDGGVFLTGTHRSDGARAALVQAEAATIPEGAHRPVVPAMLALRDQPLN